MSKPTASEIPPPRPPATASKALRPPHWLLAGAALYAAAELAAGLALGRFFDWGKAEALLFLAFRPWLLIAAAALVARRRWPLRTGFYAAALLTAGLSETLLLLALGAGDPWPEMLRGVAAGALLLVPVDLALQLGLRLHRRYGRLLATVLLLLLLLVPGAPRPYERLALGPVDGALPSERPRLLLMTGLPIIWGESGPFDPASRPAAFYRMLQDEYEVVALDYLDDGTLGQGRLMLLAQPRALAPLELVALDSWVRRGGRLLVLADPRLAWPSELPLGDIRRPPPANLLSPLLRHWGLRLEPAEAGLVTLRTRSGGRDRRLALAAPGRFSAEGGACRTGAEGLVAVCEVGEGRALLVADADMLRDELWLLPGGPAGARHFRLADNPLVVFDWLDRLAGVERERAAAPVTWIRPGAGRRRALALAVLPAILLAGLALALLRRRG